jgi:predicted MPP superfamily phosphohydrolase
MVAAVTIGVMLYLLLSTLLVDGVRLFSSFPAHYYGLASIGLTLLVVVYGTWNSWNIRTTTLDIPIKGLTEEVRAAHLSDIHIGHFRGHKFMQNIVDKTKAADVDVVFITGDLFDGRIRLNMEVIAPLKQLEVPIYFVEGNHDGYSNVKEIKHKLSKTGIHVLSNQVEILKGLQIIGLNHIVADENTTDIHASAGGPTVKSALETLPISKDQAAILLHHSPNGVKYANRAGVDLFLAGHTHAGQLWPINHIAHAMFAYNRGLHDYKDSKILISEGIGTFGPPMRVGTKSEVIIINLKKQ